MGFAFAEIGGGPYRDETACYRFSTAEVDALEEATAELERLCGLAVERAIREDRRAALGVPFAVWEAAVASWDRGEPSLYGRMDLRWDGTGPPLLLEYNADTPTALFEASVVQWEWLRCAAPEADQSNAIHEALIAAWPRSARVSAAMTPTTPPPITQTPTRAGNAASPSNGSTLAAMPIPRSRPTPGRSSAGASARHPCDRDRRRAKPNRGPGPNKRIGGRAPRAGRARGARCRRQISSSYPPPSSTAPASS